MKGSGTLSNLIVYPPFTPQRLSANPEVAPGHLFGTREDGVSIWGKDVLAFLTKSLRTSP